MSKDKDKPFGGWFAVWFCFCAIVGVTMMIFIGYLAYQLVEWVTSK